MTKKVMITIAGLLSVAVIATTALAFGPGRGPGYGPSAGGDFRGPAGLNLTTDQMSQINKMRETQFTEIRPLQSQMAAKRDALRKLWLEPNPDQAKILAAQKEMNAIRDQVQEKMTAFRLNEYKILTPEQKEKVKFMAAGRGFGPAKGKGQGGWMGCPGAGSNCGAGCAGSGPKARHGRR